MAKITIIKEQTWPYLKTLINFLIDSRDKEQITELNVGINYSIILHSACYVEGILEDGLKGILRQRRDVYNSIDIPDFYRRKTINILFKSIEEDIENKISRTTGIENYNAIFKLLTDKNINEFPSIKPLMEGIQVLFQFRNVLAHGREISTRLISAYWIEEPYKEFYFGGYKKAENYLLKKGLINKKFSESDSAEVYFTNVIADHFWDISKTFLKIVANSLDDDIKDTFKNIINFDRNINA